MIDLQKFLIIFRDVRRNKVKELVTSLRFRPFLTHFGSFLELVEALMRRNMMLEALEVATLLLTFPEPAFSWKMPDANFGPHHHQLERFFHSDQPSMVYGSIPPYFMAFENVEDAKKFMNEYFKPGVRYDGYIATAVAGGRGTTPYVQIIKTTDF